VDVIGNIGLSDVQQAWGAVSKLDPRPLRLAGRLAGLGTTELDAGVPTWAWVTVAFGAGALAAIVFGDRISDKVRSVF
jgi:hypothetical protein